MLFVLKMYVIALSVISYVYELQRIISAVTTGQKIENSDIFAVLYFMSVLLVTLAYMDGWK